MNFIDDWRNTGQEAWLIGVKLYPKGYKTYREGWDHDHSEFCMAKFSVLIPDCLTEGWATEDDYRWICKECSKTLKIIYYLS